MKRPYELRDEIDRLRQMTDDDIDYSDIPETNEACFNTAELALEPAEEVVTIRKYLSKDCAEIISLFRDTVHFINAGDYTPEQLYTWAPDKIEVEKWNFSLKESYTLVALEGNIIVGFGNIDETTNLLDRLFVHKDYQRRGIASTLCDKLESRLAGKNIITCASITARPFFEKRGYAVVEEQETERNCVKLKNYFMIKKANDESGSCNFHGKP